MKKSNVSGLFKDFCMESTIQGLKYFYLYPDIVSRCFWTVCMIFSAMLAWVLTNLLYSRFMLMPTRITIEDQYAPVTGLPFPAVTICSPNQISISNMDHFNRTLVDGDLNLDLGKWLPQTLGYYEMIPDHNADKLGQLQDLIDSNRHYIPQVMASLPQSCESFLRLCIMENLPRDCSDLFHPILTSHGLCCIFNSPYYLHDNRNVKDANFKPLYPLRGGVFHAVTIISDYNPADALDGTLLSAGAIRVMFNDWMEFPSDDQSCLIYPYVEAFLFMHGTHTYCSEEVATLPPESRRCIFETEAGLSFSNHAYRNSDCDLMCYLSAVDRRCNCSLFYVPGYRRTKLCNLTSIPCIMDTKSAQARTVNTGPDICECQRDCDSRTYRIEANIGNLGAAAFTINDLYREIPMNKSTTVMHLAFPNSFYVKQKQETVMSLINLVSNLGGVFGLCMGCSAFSVLEIIFFIYKLISNKLKRKNTKI